MELMRWMTGQPRNVVVKLNDMSSGEADGIFRSVVPTQSNDRGELCYSVAAVRMKAQSYRYETTLKAVHDHLDNSEKVVRDHLDNSEKVVRESLDEQRGLFANFGEQLSRAEADIKGTRMQAELVGHAVVNGSNKGKGVTPSKVGKMLGGCSAATVRRYARKGWFPKSLPLSRGNNQRYAFHPIKVNEDIADIKNNRLGKRRRKS